jgi:hypothetical protein
MALESGFGLVCFRGYGVSHILDYSLPRGTVAFLYAPQADVKMLKQDRGPGYEPL